ncbi:MAG TPA: HD domain-containing protein [Terriglobia bacterium]|nr:HD domain-containing protein [Terriglobia bacterium]
MKQDFVADLKPDTVVHTTFLVHIKERKTANNGSAYLDLALRDSTGVVSAKLWDCDRFKLDFEAGDVVWVDGTVEEYRGTAQIRVRKISQCPSEDFDLRDYLPRSLRDPAEMYANLLERLRRVPEGPLRSLLLAVLEDPEIAEKYKMVPAATSFHHAYLGGLLEHVTSLVELGDRLCDHYGWLDRDLVLAGLVLHDLGKTEELNFTRGFSYTTRGQLLGHITIGLEIIGEKMRQIQDFPGDLKDKIEHLVLSHHGKMEFGSPKEPMFPEALLIHYLDDMDSKLESMRAQYVTDKDRAGDWTARNRALGRELLKPTPEGSRENKPEAVRAAPATTSDRPQLDFRNGQKKP